MKWAKIYVECKKSKNFQTHTVGVEAELSDGDILATSVAELQARCRKHVMDALALDVVK